MRTRAPRHLAPEEESYFASMTDVLVGLLFVFIIMLMAFALRYRDAEARKREETVKMASADELARQAKEEILRNVADYLSRRGVTVHVDERHGVLRLPEDTLFDRARADLNPKGREALSRVAEALALFLPCYVPARPAGCPDEPKAYIDAVFIEGHTDSDPMRPGAKYLDNLELSTARAATAWRAITGRDGGMVDDLPAVSAPAGAILFADAALMLGTLQNRDGRPVLSVSGYGDQRPLTTDPSEDGKRANRRIDLRLLMATLKPEELDELAHRIGTRTGP